MKLVRHLPFVLLTLIAFPTYAEFSCPPHEDKEECMRAVVVAFQKCKEEWTEVLHDKDALTSRYQAFYMRNDGCEEQSRSDAHKCILSCS